MFNIAEFNSVIAQNGGPLRSNKFRVRFLPPAVLGNQIEAFRHLEYMAEQAALPGVNLSTHEVRRYGYGPIEKRPLNTTFTDANFTFIADGNADIHRLFYNWIEAISPFNMSEGIGPSTYLLQYKQTYVTDLHVQVFNGKGSTTDEDADGNEIVTPPEPVIDLVLREAFPVSLADNQFTWSEMNNYAKFSVQFAYHDWYLERNPSSRLAT